MTSAYSEEWLADRLARQELKTSPEANTAQESVLERATEPRIGKRYAFTVFGLPATAGSKQAFALVDKKIICRCGPIPGPIPRRRQGGSIIINVVDDNKDSDRWKAHVAKTAREEYPGPLFLGALSVTFRFFRPRPRSHIGASGLNKEGRAHPFPITRPDALKYARAAEDGLTGVVWADDSIIVDEHIYKRWGTPARVEITVEELLIPDHHNQRALFDLPSETQPTGTMGDGGLTRVLL